MGTSADKRGEGTKGEEGGHREGGRLGRGERGITNESGRQKISCLFSMRLLHSAHSQKLWEGSNNYLKSSLFLLCLRSCCSYPAAFSLITGELPADLAGRSRQDVCSANKLKKKRPLQFFASRFYQYDWDSCQQKMCSIFLR